MRVIFQLALTAACCAPMHGARATAAPNAEMAMAGKLDSDQTLHGAGGVQLTGAAGWNVQRREGVLILEAPERDLLFAVIAVDAPSARDALRAALPRLRAGAPRIETRIDSEPARHGWEARAAGRYNVSANARQVVSATALRAAGKWIVVLTEGAVGTAQKRGAALDMMRGSLRPQAYRPETFAGRKANPLDAARIARLRKFVEGGMRELRIPGAALALIDQGNIVYEGGLGVREHGKPARVDAHTVFMAASNTKSMTTMLLASLADDGKLRWDQPVTDLYPGFKLGDPDTTARVQFKHLVCACTGLPRQDFEMMFEFGNATPSSSIALLANTKPTSAFGDIYQYSNLMASAAGFIGGALAHPGMEPGAAYDKAMQQRIFAPLGMRDTTFDMAAALRGNHAKPHTLDYANQLRATGIEMDSSIVPHRPAGGVWTSAHDFIRYVQLEAKQGKLGDGTALISRDNLLARRAPQVQAGDGLSYGMGLETMTVSGISILNHGGSLPGFKSNYWLLPEAGVGAVLMTNADGGWELIAAFQRYLLEELYDGKPEAAEDLQLAAQAARIGYARNRTQYTVPPARQVVRGLALRYRSPDLGELAVTHQGKQTFLDAGEWKTGVASHKNKEGTVSLRTITPGLDSFEFFPAEREGKRVLIMHGDLKEYVFSEVE